MSVTLVKKEHHIRVGCMASPANLSAFLRRCHVAMLPELKNPQKHFSISIILWQT
jgi:hypothetical protein